jgi:hypothetical protein
MFPGRQLKKFTRFIKNKKIDKLSIKGEGNTWVSICNSNKLNINSFITSTVVCTSTCKL